MRLLIILGLVTPYFLEEQRSAWPWLQQNVCQFPGRAFTKLMGKCARNKSLNQINEMLTCHEQNFSPAASGSTGENPARGTLDSAQTLLTLTLQMPGTDDVLSRGNAESPASPPPSPHGGQR